jgi:hypothetical protein
MMCASHSHPADRGASEIELNQHSRFLSEDPSVVAWLNIHNLWCREFQVAAILILNTNSPAYQKSYMRMHAKRGANQRLHVGRPSKTCGVYQPLNPSRADADCIDRNTADFPVFRSGIGAKIGSIEFMLASASLIDGLNPPSNLNRISSARDFASGAVRLHHSESDPRRWVASQRQPLRSTLSIAFACAVVCHCMLFG